MKLEENKVITLGNGENYLIISHITIENKDYYYIAECDEEAKNIKENYKIVESTVDNGITYIDEVIGESNLKKVLPVFVKNIKSN